MEKDESAMTDQAVEDLTLLLLYLTSWEEKVYGDLTVHRAWKGYLFEVLDALEEAGYLNQTRRAKSVTLTEAGLEQARALAARYLVTAAQDL
jgi:DNA-binding PadR family transcriptional regulator